LKAEFWIGAQAKIFPIFKNKRRPNPDGFAEGWGALVTCQTVPFEIMTIHSNQHPPKKLINADFSHYY